MKIQVLVFLLSSVQVSECVWCYARFDLDSGRCHDELGEVEQDDCCQNPDYGFLTTDGSCQSCGPTVWSTWSPWSQCNVLSDEGVRQRSRTCYGIGQSQCSKVLADRLQTEPCNGTCSDAEGWDLWSAWSPCSITCGGAGVRERRRTCLSRPECESLTCAGPSQESEACLSINTCPVHGGWADWAAWSECSGPCVDDRRPDGGVPVKERVRTCSSPAPSNDTAPHGDGCPGDDTQVTECSELPNCPVDGNWGAWSPPGPCSSSCGEGLQLSTRTCDSPAPKYGGRFCQGTNAQASACLSSCPVDGVWSGWSSWAECVAPCVPQDGKLVRTRTRSCTNPAPSSSPPGRECQGSYLQMEDCTHIPPCPVDGGWGPWSPFSPCPVTCGVGLQVSVRSCDSPPPQHGGRECSGEEQRTSICTTNVHCPVDGVWSQWSAWGSCTFAFGAKKIKCEKVGGLQTRQRDCEGRAHGGNICEGNHMLETRPCYDVQGCFIKGSWDGWEPWTVCKPPCGPNSVRLRRMKCNPDYSQYRPRIGRLKELAAFHGRPLASCGPTPDGGPGFEEHVCANVPACPAP